MALLCKKKDSQSLQDREKAFSDLSVMRQDVFSLVIFERKKKIEDGASGFSRDDVSDNRN